MYWLDSFGEYQDLTISECKETLQSVNAELRNAAGSTVVLEIRDEGWYEQQALVPGEKSVMVRSIKRRRLPFYPQDSQSWWLYRIQCEAGGIGGLCGYDTETAIFCVASVGEGGLLKTTTLLDWTRAPISRVNAQIGLDLDQLDDVLVREYFIFFLSFYGVEADALEGRRRQPFAVPPDFDALLWNEDIDTLEDVAHRQNIKLFPASFPPDDPDPPDFPPPTGKALQQDAPPEEAPCRVEGYLSGRERRQAIKQCFAKPNPATTGSSVPSGDAGDTAPRLSLEAVVWHCGVLFRADYAVLKDGSVNKLSQGRIAGGQELPVSQLESWESRELFCGIWALCHHRPRKARNGAGEIVQRIKDCTEPEGDAKPGGSCLSFRQCRIEGELVLALTLSRRLRFEDVEFTGNVRFDDCIFEHSVEFLNCRFLRSLSLRNATVKGSLVLTRSRIEGGLPSYRQLNETDGAEPAVMLDGITVGHDVIADQLDVRGMVSGQCMRVTGNIQARALRAGLRRPHENTKPQLDFSFSRINGQLDLSASTGDSRNCSQVRTRLDGHLRLQSLAADSLKLSGAIIAGDLHLSFASCAGSIDLTSAWESSSQLGASARAWRTQVTGRVQLDFARVRLLRLHGCHILREVSLRGTEVSNSIYAGFDGGFQCHIGGEMNASGAVISGDLQLNGIRMDNEFAMISGRCSRLRLGCGFWFEGTDEGKYKARITPARVGGIFLAGVTVANDVFLPAVQVGNAGGSAPGYANGGILATGVRLGGSFRFWGEDTEAIMVVSANQKLLEKKLPHDKLRAGDASISSLKAEIGGDLDLRGIQVGSTIDLGRASIGGCIQLGNAHIGGDLLAAEKCLTSCKSFKANIAKVTGNVNLRALRADALVARGLEAGGSVLLTGPEEEGAEDYPEVKNSWPAAQCSSIQLEAVTASRLWVTARNIENVSTGSIGLARAHLGELGIGGFVDKPTRLRVLKRKVGERVYKLTRRVKRDTEVVPFSEATPPYKRTEKMFPVSINLSRIEVGYWKIDPDTEVVPLLEATKPFDRNIYIALEERLAKLAYRTVADKAWRKMVWRDARENKGWTRCKRRLVAGANAAFSRQGTSPTLMAAWLILSVVLVFWILADPRNVQETSAAIPGSIASWSAAKAIGLAFGNAVPLYGLSRSGWFQPRICGSTFFSHTFFRGTQSDEAWMLPVSPFDLVQLISICQIVLWLFIAANLPSIFRRRG